MAAESKKQNILLIIVTLWCLVYLLMILTYTTAPMNELREFADSLVRKCLSCQCSGRKDDCSDMLTHGVKWIVKREFSGILRFFIYLSV